MIEFDASTHTYTNRETGEAVPGWSEIARALGISRTQYIPDWALERGRYVHEACDYWERGVLDTDDLDQEIGAYLDSFRDWYREVNPELLSSEEMVWHREEGYAGTLDRIYSIDSKITLVDIKCGRHSPHYRLQTAAYMAAALPKYKRKKMPITRRGCLMLRPGAWEWIEHEDMADIDAAIAAARVYRWMRGAHE